MENVRISNDERLITLTKGAYDLMNDELTKLKHEKTIKLNIALFNSYRDREKFNVDYYIDISIPENLKDELRDFEHIVYEIQSLLNEKSKKLDIEINKYEKLKNEVILLKEQINYVPKWIIKLFNKNQNNIWNSK